MTTPPPPAQPHGTSGPGGIPSPGVPGPASTAPRKTSRAPKILLILGGVILVLSVVIGIVLAVIGISGAAGSITELEEHPTGQATLEASAGDTYVLFAVEGQPAPVCDVTGPAAVANSDTDMTVEVGGTSWQSFQTFTVEEAGTYEVDCSAGPVAVGPPLSVGGVLTGVGGILLAIGGGMLGFVLLAIGVVLLILGRRKNA